MRFETIIGTNVLSDHLSDPGWAIVDCRYRLDDSGWGDKAFTEAHIPGASYAHLVRDLAGRKTGANGRHPLPDPVEFQATLGRLGIGAGVQVVAYDQDTGMFASRLWWLLRWMGHDSVAVLDGGFAKWMLEGRAVEPGPSRAAAREFSGTLREGLTATIEEVASLSASSSHRLVDARSPERYRGETEPIDRAAGHIPGAVNHPYQTNVRDDGTFLDSESLKRLWEGTLAGVSPRDAIVYCGSGVTACQNLLAMELAGLSGGRLFPGSWSEWSSDPGRPVATGKEPR